MTTAATITETERIVLTAVLADYRAIEASLNQKPLDWHEERFRTGARPEFFDGFGVRIDHCGWAGMLEHNPTISKRYQRAILKLDALGLLERCNIYGRRKATHVKLTADGRQLAELFAGDPHNDSNGQGSNEGNSDGT